MLMYWTILSKKKKKPGVMQLHLSEYLLSRTILLHAKWIYSLKSLCYAIRAGCLLMNLHALTRQMKTGHGGWLINLYLVFKSARQGSLYRVPRFKHRMCSIALTYQYSCHLAVHSWRSWASQLDHRQNLCTSQICSPYTPMHYTTILGASIFPVHHVNWIF